MVSDDTDHACMVTQCLISSGDDPDLFEQFLARELRLWLITLPAGVGLATLRATVKLWFGASPAKSGVFSAGNGPAMRSPIIGVYCTAERPSLIRALINASTRLTHSDPKAEYGAFAIALAAAMASKGRDIDPESYVSALSGQIGAQAQELMELVTRASISAKMGQSSEAFCSDLGLPQHVTGYMYHTVPVVIQTWLRHQSDFAGGITEIIRCGGDTDTTAAILGGIIGARVGKEGIPPEWLSGLQAWPHTVEWMEELGRRLFLLAHGLPSKGMPENRPGLFLRNMLLLAAVMAHGFRRLLPPYG